MTKIDLQNNYNFYSILLQCSGYLIISQRYPKEIDNNILIIYN